MIFSIDIKKSINVFGSKEISFPCNSFLWATRAQGTSYPIYTVRNVMDTYCLIFTVRTVQKSLLFWVAKHILLFLFNVGTLAEIAYCFETGLNVL